MARRVFSREVPHYGHRRWWGTKFLWDSAVQRLIVVYVARSTITTSVLHPRLRGKMLSFVRYKLMASSAAAISFTASHGTSAEFFKVDHSLHSAASEVSKSKQPPSYSLRVSNALRSSWRSWGSTGPTRRRMTATVAFVVLLMRLQAQPAETVQRIKTNKNVYSVALEVSALC